MIIRHGKVLLPTGFAAVDIRTDEGRISEIGEGVVPSDGEEVIDASGCIVTPGLCDYHVHAFKYGHLISVDIDELAPRTGVTTFVDAGSVGGLLFPAFRAFVIDRTDLNLFAFINISALGQTTSGIRGLDFHDNDARTLINLPLVREMLEKHSDVIKGIKVRAYTGLTDLYAMEQARILGDETGLAIMVHLAPAPPPLGEVLAYLRAGDVITHPYHGGGDTIIDANGRIRAEFVEARARGIEVDLGMDRFHCDLTVMRAAFDLGFYPDFVSTDITLTNLNSVLYDLPTTISKCVALGMPEESVFRAATRRVAQKLAVPGLEGEIAVGHTADLAVFRWDEHGNPLEDYFGNRIKGRRLKNVATILRGRRLAHRRSDLVLPDSVQTSVPWKNYA